MKTYSQQGPAPPPSSWCRSRPPRRRHRTRPRRRWGRGCCLSCTSPCTLLSDPWRRPLVSGIFHCVPFRYVLLQPVSVFPTCIKLQFSSVLSPFNDDNLLFFLGQALSRLFFLFSLRHFWHGLKNMYSCWIEFGTLNNQCCIIQWQVRQI